MGTGEKRTLYNDWEENARRHLENGGFFEGGEGVRGPFHERARRGGGGTRAPPSRRPGVRPPLQAVNTHRGLLYLPMDTDREGADGPLPSPGRLWTVEEANARLGELRELLPRLRAAAVRLRRAQEQLERLSAFWGRELDATDQPDKAVHARLRQEAVQIEQMLEEELHRLHDDGIEVKDLDRGLLDFYGIQAGEVVFLCWQRSEDEVGYFHPLDGGFRNRRPIDRAAQRVPPARRP